MKFHEKAFGLALGILWGGTVCLATLWAIFGGGGEHIELIAKFYFGYAVNLVGALVGLVWGFIHGFVAGWLFAWLYNRFAPGS